MNSHNGFLSDQNMFTFKLQNNSFQTTRPCTSRLAGTWVPQCVTSSASGLLTPIIGYVPKIQHKMMMLKCPLFDFQRISFKKKLSNRIFFNHLHPRIDCTQHQRSIRAQYGTLCLHKLPLENTTMNQNYKSSERVLEIAYSL